VRYTLSKEKTIFLRGDKRGTYYLDKKNPFYSEKMEVLEESSRDSGPQPESYVVETKNIKPLSQEEVPFIQEETLPQVSGRSLVSDVFGLRPKKPLRPQKLVETQNIKTLPQEEDPPTQEGTLSQVSGRPLVSGTFGLRPKKPLRPQKLVETKTTTKPRPLEGETPEDVVRQILELHGEGTFD
jgi:hypothetical protein